MSVKTLVHCDGITAGGRQCTESTADADSNAWLRGSAGLGKSLADLGYFVGSRVPESTEMDLCPECRERFAAAARSLLAILTPFAPSSEAPPPAAPSTTTPPSEEHPT